MTTIAIIGAGPGLGAAVARRFGREGHSVALVARDAGRLDALAGSLAADGVTARGFTADVHDPATLVTALDAAADTLGPVEVLQYSPLPRQDFMRPVLDTTADDLTGPIEFSLYGAVTAVRQVVPGMRELGRGTVLFVNGGSAVVPHADRAGTSVAFAAQSAYGHLIHNTLAPEGIHVAQLIIPGMIEPGHQRKDPVVLAETLWGLHRERHGFRHFADDLGA
ncbi:SDR family NAD(P)-dependent oxidoreductase [Streptomyces mangrovisoli]|uniref:Dehydrogenase n=1 Tax=Streptomyces mangrovisoli TaxID=1428628 RepID=A0A1J4NM42_9ACTN|nr:SDR family NAD(P)-dependent oxidoreductase [Streptomyces mangrovisoli]OIJ62684.1 dehydrogenase [Streptomyces mangrovisoli]